MVFLSCSRERTVYHHVQGSTTVNNVHPVLRHYDRFGLGCVRFFDWRAALEESCFVHVCVRLFYFVELFVEFPRFAWCVIFLMLCLISASKLQVWRVGILVLPWPE